MKYLLLAVLLMPVCAFAAKKPEPIYQDAIFKSFSLASDGESCGPMTSGGQNCSADHVAHYAVTIGGSTLILRPIGFKFKNSCLYGVLPGTTIQIAPDGTAKYKVLVGSKESEYRLVGAQ